MEVGMFHLMPWQQLDERIGWPFADEMYDPEVGTDLYKKYLDQLEYAEPLGFDFVGLNEHHYSAYGLMPGPNLIAANLANRTKIIDVAVYGTVLPIRGHPIRVAEEYAMLDNLLEGRFRAGFVRGIPSEYFAYNVHPDNSRGRFREAWDLILEAWTAEEPFDWNGEYWQYDDVYIWPRPAQDPHPPVWRPAASEQSIRWAAEHRVPISDVYSSTEEIAEVFDTYRKFAENEFGWSPDDSYFGPMRPIYISESREQAREEIEEHAQYFYEVLRGSLYRSGALKAVGDAEYHSDHTTQYRKVTPEDGLRAIDFDFDDLIDRGEFIIGSPAEVIEEIEEQYDAMGGIGFLITLLQFGSMPHEMVRENMERFADDVLPEIRGLTDASMAHGHSGR